MTQSNRVYGIDLGTTYSCIACVDEHGKPVVLANAEGQPTTPSVVFFEAADNIVVGKTAKDVAVLHPDRVVSTVKRVMGDPSWVFECHGNTYHPQDVSSFILRKLVADAQIVTGETVTDVVITCPAYFGVTQKEATRQAGELAGLNVRYVIPEPTAAAIAYGIQQSNEQVILVYDLGGGTFDVTLIDVKPEAITVICTGGDHQLGGKNWDEAIAAWFAEQFSNETGIAADVLMNNPETWQELVTVAENAKVALSTRKSFPYAVRHDVDHVKVELTREKFDELTAHLLGRTISLTEELVKTARDEKGYSKIDKLLLVGGSTYMPQVIDAVKKRFPYDVMQFDPNQAVAKGAAVFGFKCYLDEQIRIRIGKETGTDAAQVDVQAVPEALRKKAEQEVAKVEGLALPDVQNLSRQKINNVTSKSFGVVVMVPGGAKRVNNLVKVDDAVPCVISRTFGTYDENQIGVTLRCMENTERVGADDAPIVLDTSSEVGTAELRFTRALPKGSPVEIKFALAADGLLSVHGKDLTTNQEIATEFKTNAILTVAEIEEKRSRNMAITVA